MPAVTVDDLSSVPRIFPVKAGEKRERQATNVVNAPRTLEGEGFEVRRAFTGIDLRLADPFILLDHMGAVEYAPGEAKGAPDHPHRGFETVTYMMDGVLEHRDSNGGGGLITDGATQWMTAGAGIVHSEMPTRQSCWPRRTAAPSSALSRETSPGTSGRAAPARLSHMPTQV